MRLTPAQVRQVQRGEKTQHRVLIVAPHEVRRPPAQGKIGRANPRTGLSATYVTETRKPAVGDSIVIQPRQEPDPERNLPEVPEVRIQITNVNRERLGDLTTETARAEGYKGNHPLADFQHDWMVRHDPGYPPETEALCPNCAGHTQYENHQGETVDCEECDEVGTILVPTRPDPETIIARFQHRHAHHLVYALQFTHQADISLWLHRRPGHPATTSIGEALDPDAPLLGEPSRQWREKAEQRRKNALRDRDGARLAGLDRLHAAYQAELHRLALEDGSDASRDARVIGDRHEKAKRRLSNDEHEEAA